MTFRIPKDSGHSSGPIPGSLHHAQFFAGCDRITGTLHDPTPGLAGEPERTLSNRNERQTRRKVRWV
jgi:hypothetical protein